MENQKDVSGVQVVSQVGMPSGRKGGAALKSNHFAVIRVDSFAPNKVIVPCLERRLAKIYVKSFNAMGHGKGPRVALCPVHLTLLPGNAKRKDE